MKTIKQTAAIILAVLLLAGLCSCGVDEQYSIRRPPGDEASDFSVPQDKGDKIGFYTDQTKSMYGFCGKTGYVTAMNEVRSLLKGEAVKESTTRQLNIYRYDSIVDPIKESYFIQHYFDGVLNVNEYYNHPENKGRWKKSSAATKKGNVKPLETALNHAYKKNQYTDSLCVFTTDLYEQNRDYAVIFKPMSDKVLKRGNAVGFMGIKSEYSNSKLKNISADNKDDYDFDGERLFYLIVAGPTDDVTSFCNALSERLSEKNIDNYCSTFIPGGRTLSFKENGIMLEPEDENASELIEVAEGKSLSIDDESEELIKEEGLDYYPTFSICLNNSGEARSTFTVSANRMIEGVEAYPLELKTEIMNYKGPLKDQTDEDEEDDEDDVGNKESGKVNKPENAPDVSGGASDELKILQQPKDTVYREGETVTVSLKAQGKDLTYQWYFKKAGKKSFTEWKSHTNATETAMPNDTWDGIQLYCEVKDGSGKKVKSKTVTVRLSDQPEETTTTAVEETTAASSDETTATNPASEKENSEITDVFLLSGVDVREAPFTVQDSMAFNTKDSVENDGKFRICTDFYDTSVIKHNGPILVKYSLCVGSLEETPSWILENSASGTSTEEEKAKTLDLTYVYDGLRHACNATMEDSELFTFYCYYYCA